MTITASVYEISALIIALAFLVFVIALVPALLQMKKTAVALEELAAEGKKTMEGLNSLLKKAGDNAGEIEDLLIKFRNAGHKIAGAVDMVIENIKSPLITIISLIMGLEAGLKHLLSREEKGGGEDVKQ